MGVTLEPWAPWARSETHRVNQDEQQLSGTLFRRSLPGGVGLLMRCKGRASCDCTRLIMRCLEDEPKVGGRRDQIVRGGAHTVKLMDKEKKGTVLHSSVADQNACLARPAPFITACPPLLTFFLDEVISCVCICMYGGLSPSDKSQTTDQRACMPAVLCHDQGTCVLYR